MNSRLHGLFFNRDWKFIAIGPDNKFYVPIGSLGNPCADPPHGPGWQERRESRDRRSAFGVRRSVGFDWNPVNGDMCSSNNGRDWVSEDIPNDTLHRVPAGTKRTMNFGFPYCH